jgi:hypothetical protein
MKKSLRESPTRCFEVWGDVGVLVTARGSDSESPKKADSTPTRIPAKRGGADFAGEVAEGMKMTAGVLVTARGSDSRIPKKANSTPNALSPTRLHFSSSSALKTKWVKLDQGALPRTERPVYRLIQVNRMKRMLVGIMIGMSIAVACLAELEVKAGGIELEVVGCRAEYALGERIELKIKNGGSKTVSGNVLLQIKHSKGWYDFIPYLGAENTDKVRISENFKPGETKSYILNSKKVPKTYRPGPGYYRVVVIPVIDNKLKPDDEAVTLFEFKVHRK